VPVYSFRDDQAHRKVIEQFSRQPALNMHTRRDKFARFKFNLRIVIEVAQRHVQYPYGIDIRTGDRDPTECAGYSGVWISMLTKYDKSLQMYWSERGLILCMEFAGRYPRMEGFNLISMLLVFRSKCSGVSLYVHKSIL